jgi:peroxiredoxin
MATTSQRLSIGAHAPNLTLTNVQDQPIHLESFLRQRPTLLTFLRHFGCPFCRDWMKQLQTHHAELDALGVQVLAVAMGEPKHARRYCGDLAPNLTCFTSTDHQPYFDYGLSLAGIGQVLNLNAAQNAIKVIIGKGTMGGPIIGDPRMLPGSFLIDSQGVVRWAFYAADVSEQPDMTDLLAHAKGLR